RPTVKASSSGPNLGPVNRGMITPAANTKKAVSAPSTIRMIQNRVEARRKASRFLPCCRRSVNTGTKAADRAAFANRLLTRFGTWKASVKADAAPVVPKKLAATTSRARPTTREMPVAIEKIAVLRATLPERGGSGGSSCSPALTDTGRYSTALRGAPRQAARVASVLSHGQHRIPKEAHPPLRARASGEPRIHLGDQDLLPSPGSARQGKRRRGHRGRAPSPRTHDRQGRQARRPAPQHRRAQEVPRGPPSRRPLSGAILRPRSLVCKSTLRELPVPEGVRPCLACSPTI